jgi:hypothetical protein
MEDELLDARTLAAGDIEGQAIRKRIVDAVLELLRDKPEEGERVN